MKYLELKQKLSEHIIFSLADIAKLDPNFYNSRLYEWKKKGYIKKIAKGLYIFSDTGIDENTLFYIANKLYHPSYVSLEMALSYYDLLPETVFSITSVSTRRTYSFNTFAGNFNYRSIKPELFFGYRIVRVKSNVVYKLAEPEKALLDFLYFNPHYYRLRDYEELRINSEMFRENIEEEKLLYYLDRFSQKKLTERVNKLLRYLND